MADPLEGFYDGLSTLLGAGLAPAEALRSLSRGAPAGPAAALLPAVEGGAAIAEGMDGHPGLFPGLDRAVVRAGEASGRLDAALRRLAGGRALARGRRDRFRAALLYPLFLLHVGLFLLCVPSFVTDGPGGFLGSLVLSFGPLYGAVAIGVVLHRRLRDRETFRDLLRRLPGVGPTLTRLALARAFRAAADLYDAGLTVDRACLAAAEACGPGALRRGFAAAGSAMGSGRGVHDSLRLVPALSANLLATFATGERAGRLSEALAAAAGRCEEEAEAALRLAAKAIPVAVYLLILAFLAVKVLSFWAGYYGRLSSL